MGSAPRVSSAGPLRRAWGIFWARAPRQLKFTREGKFLVGIALGAGFAAINTGNNLLFLGWGMVLSAIVLSGVLSEATLRVVEVDVDVPPDPRAGQGARLPMVIAHSGGRFPALAIQTDLRLRGPDGVVDLEGASEIRIAPGTSHRGHADWVPDRRGEYEVIRVRARTSYPFGFFEKSRRFRAGRRIWVAPGRVEVSGLLLDLHTRLGEELAGRSGPGDDFFSLRPFRAGDDPRRVHWRRSARTGRLVARETEARASRSLLLELIPGEGDPERAIEVVGSLAEDLLALGYRVGLQCPGAFVSPAQGGRQRWSILLALARVRPGDPRVSGRIDRATARVAVVGSGGTAPSHCDVVLPVTDGPSRGDRAA